MQKLKLFFRQSFIGGVLVLLPLVILGFFFHWAFVFITNLIQPITDTLNQQFHVPELVADLLAIVLLLAICFVVGTLVSTGVGKWLHEKFDKYLTKLAPGYRLIKEIIGQFLGDPASSPFGRGEVVRVKLFGEDCPTTVTALITARHPDGAVTVFMPTGPNPTSGNIYHLPQHLVEEIPHASVEAMMKSIIACGAGSDKLFTPPHRQ
jgi:uncharacterized membrane protein